MEIDSLACSLVYSKEELDFLEWSKKEKNNQFSLYQNVKINGIVFTIVGGTIDGNIYLQRFKRSVPKVKRRFDSKTERLIIFWKVLKMMIK